MSWSGGKICLVASVISCGAETPNSFSSQTYLQDSGIVCLYASSVLDNNEQLFEAEQAITVLYKKADVCLSSNCTESLMASCFVDDAGVIHSVATWRARDPSDEVCTDDCRLPQSVCYTSALTAGEHTFSFGQDSVRISIPESTDTPLCLLNM